MYRTIMKEWAQSSTHS